MELKNGNDMEQRDGCGCCHKTKERPDKEYRDLIHRLNRIEGQIRGIRGMVERDAGAGGGGQRGPQQF